MAKIKLLDKNLINQIAAGEVVERPASVVKELVENSIDAGSTRVEINVSNDCRNIRIADNGSGIDPGDIELAFSKHATSKISKQEDLFDINTMGFRGEALASLISIAKVTCITKQKDNEAGTKAVCENSNMIKTPTGCANGTTMEIEDLFYNVAARLKFLKNEKTEMAYITEITQAIALSNPNVALILKNKGYTSLQTLGTSSLLSTIGELYSNDIVNELKKVSKEDTLSSLSIEGYVSNPTYTRSSNKSIHVFVNKRVVKCPIILKTISNVYQNLIPKGKYPFAVLNITLPPADVDVNVHPTKREVRYKNPNQIFNFVYTALNEALSGVTPVLAAENETPLLNTYSQTNSFNRFSSKPFTPTLERQEECTYVSQPVETEQIMEMYKPVEQQALAIEEPKIEERIKIVGQYDNTYILVENTDNLEIIDQHIAQERYYYEKLKDEQEIASQVLLFSDVIDLEPTDVQTLKTNSSELEKYGYGIEFLSATEITFRKLPQLIAHAQPADIVTGLLDEIYNEEGSIEEKILISMSCKASIKANTALTAWQMEDIVKKLRTTRQPATCPHGRPISKFIPKNEIASYFMR